MQVGKWERASSAERVSRAVWSHHPKAGLRLWVPWAHPIHRPWSPLSSWRCTSYTSAVESPFLLELTALISDSRNHTYGGTATYTGVSGESEVQEHSRRGEPREPTQLAPQGCGLPSMLYRELWLAAPEQPGLSL